MDKIIDFDKYTDEREDNIGYMNALLDLQVPLLLLR